MKKASRFLDVNFDVQETGGFCSICIYRIKRWLCSGPVKHEKLQYATAPEKNHNSIPGTDRLCGCRRGLVVRGSAGERVELQGRCRQGVGSALLLGGVGAGFRGG